MAPRVLLAMFLMAASAYATTVQRLGLEDLTKKAHDIVVGRVTNSRTYWSSNRKLIFTSYTLQVDESIKGQAARSVEITTIGGKIGDVELHVSGMPSFQSGESAVVFLEQSAGYQTVRRFGPGQVHGDQRTGREQPSAIFLFRMAVPASRQKCRFPISRIESEVFLSR